ncbi:MAG: transposase [Oscillospiraceae bacterium]|nr:transposase [Oscillospiraceae bacterium]
MVSGSRREAGTAGEHKPSSLYLPKVLISSIFSAKEIYLSYKQRWDIEQCFDYLKNSVSSSASHAHTDEHFRGWAFLNHVSLLYYYGLINALRDILLDDKYSAEDVLKLTKNIYRVDTGDGQGVRVSAIQKKTQELLDALGVDLLREK